MGNQLAHPSFSLDGVKRMIIKKKYTPVLNSPMEIRE